MAKYKVDQQLTHKPSNQVVTVVHVTPYHAADDQHAVVTVRTKQNTLINVPVAVQDDYLTTEPPKKGLFAKWPLAKQ